MTKLREQDAEQRRANKLGPDFSEALSRGLHVIEAFSQTRRAMSLAEVARAVDLPKATTRRALHTLLHTGYLEADGRMFSLTPQVLRLAQAYLVSNMVSTVLQPTCERLTRETGQICSAAVLDKGDIVMIARSIPAQMIAIGAGIGFRLPAINTSLGRVLLSVLPVETIDHHLETAGLSQTSFTVTDPQRLRLILQDVRVSGYCYVDQEAEYHFRSIAVPIRRFDGNVVAAIHIGGHADQISEAIARDRYLSLLLATSDDLRHQII